MHRVSVNWSGLALYRGLSRRRPASWALLALAGGALLGCREAATSPQGGAGAVSAIRAAAPTGTGFGTETVLSTTSSGNGWEPAIAADPGAPYVYAAWMQFNGTKILITYRVSGDGGASWGAPKLICGSCGGQSQYDIVLATTSPGAVYAVWMRQSRIIFSKSTNHGATWSTPLTVSGGTWGDKPWLTTSANGQDVYVVWTTRGNLFAAVSHDGGSTFAVPLQITFEDRLYYFANGATVLPNGTALIVAAGYPGQGATNKPTGPIPISVLRTTNGGTGWTRTDADTVYTGVGYPTSSVATMASDGSGSLLLVYSGSTAVGASGRVWVRRSTNSGATWTPKVEMTTSTGGADATSVGAAGRGTGDFRITWMDARTGAWNVWARQSSDGGITWTNDVQVSNASSGRPYKTAAGFGLPYGDYHMVAINSSGKSVIVMGEGDATQTNGDIWVNRQP